MEFKPGDKIELSNCSSAEIIRKLGEGGQGIVYEVKVGNEHLALKWYTCKFPHKTEFIRNMKEKLIGDGTKAPDEKKFLWPRYFAEEQTLPGHQSSFGYVMNLRPKEYSDFADFLNAKVRFPSMGVRVLAALNFVSAFMSLHRKGFSYQDLNDGNFFINMQTGDVLICDNDNVTPGNSQNFGQVGGKPGYMAPEVVTGEKHPGTLTDYYSLAVILFKLFIVHDPVMGKQHFEATRKDTLPEVEMELYGKNPVFIFDPGNTSNRPMPDIHKNPVNLWPLYPEFFRQTFIDAFVAGMKEPNARLPENVWQKALIRLRDELAVCPKCSQELFLWEGDRPRCDDCGAVFNAPPRLSVNSFTVPLFPGQSLYACHTTTSGDNYTDVTGKVVTSKKDIAQLGLRNLSGDIWAYHSEKGETISAGNGAVIPINLIKKIEFKNTTGRISQAGESAEQPGFFLLVKNYRLPLTDGQVLYACHVLARGDEKTIMGKIVSNKKDTSLLGIRNMSEDEWVFIDPSRSNERKSIKKGEVFPLPSTREAKWEMLVNFKDISGKIVVDMR